jgi:hypothetical protein
MDLARKTEQNETTKTKTKQMVHYNLTGCDNQNFKGEKIYK